MDTQQIYTIVNEINSQSMGEKSLAVVDSNSFIALGQQVLSSQDNVENFLNTLVERIAFTIVSFRAYNSILSPIVFGSIEWGAIVQKLKVEMPEAVEDEAYDLEDGESVDQYIIRKPKVNQKFFVKRAPYSFFVTIQRWQLKRAFTSESAFGAFISAIFGEIQNKLEVTFENLGYLCMDNFIANVKPAQTINLVSEYNAVSGNNVPVGEGALFNSGFLRYAIGRMNKVAFRLRSMSKLYNAEGYERHTPIADQRFITMVDFTESMKTVVQWEAFHRDYVSKAADIVIPHWQAPDKPFDIYVTDKGGVETNIKNIVAFIHDRNALGTYRKEQETLTTPVNARGRYTNTFYHEEQLWFNDLSENGIIFTLN